MIDKYAILVIQYEIDNKISEYMVFIVKDSGKRKDFKSGMRRDIDDNKPRYDLIYKPLLKRWAMVMMLGAKKYNMTDTPITCENWKSVVYLCTCKEIIIKSQTVTQTDNTQVEESVLNAIQKNIQNQKEPHVVQTELCMSNQGDCVEYVMTDILKKQTQNMQDGREKTMTSGSQKIKTNIKKIVNNTEKEQKTKSKDTLGQEKISSQVLGLVQKMNSDLSKSKVEGVLSVEDKLIDTSLTSITAILQEKYGDSCVGVAIKDSECLEIILKDLKKHLPTCVIHRSIVWRDNILHIRRSAMNNWQLANSEEELKRFYASANRHFEQWMSGEVDEDHAGQCMFNIGAVEMLKEKLKK